MTLKRDFGSETELAATRGESSDEVLMVRVAEGDVEAYEALYHRYRNRILTFVFRYVGDRDIAEDLAQEVFLKLYRSPRSFDPRNRFMTWLFTVARNLAIDHLRKKKPATALTQEGEDGEFSLEPPEPLNQGPVDKTLLKEMEENLQSILMTLSDKLREVFVLCAMQGLAYEEVAQIVGCPAKTVSSRLARARRRFVEELDPYLSGKKSP
ncbi:MAG: sigma-70 family RNA polymerase sigma factor [Planctomycetota bacterium]